MSEGPGRDQEVEPQVASGWGCSQWARLIGTRPLRRSSSSRVQHLTRCPLHVPRKPL